MKNDSIEERLGVLANELNRRPSIAERIAKDLEKREPLSRVALPSRHRIGSRGRWIGAGTASVAAVLLLVFLTSTASVSFAQVQSALANIRTVMVSQTFAEHPELSQRMLASVDHDAYRSEHDNGAVFIQHRNGRTLLLNTKNKTGQVTPGAGFGREGERPTPIDYLKSLQEIEATAVNALGEKSFDGKTLIGFELPPIHGAKRSVWVDPDTKLPVREEVARIGDIPGTHEGFAAYRMPASVSTYEFNVEIAADAFSMSPPGYTLVDFREFQAPWHTQKPLRDGVVPKDLVLTPGGGLGTVDFGMSQKQVVSIFGAPDEELVMGEFTEVEEVGERADSEKMDEYELNRELQRILNSQPQRVIKREGVSLHYYMLGVDITIDDDRGVTGIRCHEKAAPYTKFAGRFENGISLASSIDEVKREFGEPSREYSGDDYSGMYFAESSVGFNFNETGEVTRIDLYRPVEE